MITQTFKRWLHKLFAWWHGAAKTSYTQPSANRNTGGTPETSSWPQIDGVAPLPSSIAVDHDPDEQRIQPSHDRVLQGPIEVPDDSAATEKEILPTMEQRMEFLRYLMKQGILNEGFEADQVPEQYRRKK